MTVKTKKTLRGKALLREVMNNILANPEKWYQEWWHKPIIKSGRRCGSAHCIGGWCQVLGGGSESSETALIDACEFADIHRDSRADLDESDWLFDGQRKLEDLYAFVKLRLTTTKRDQELVDAAESLAKTIKKKDLVPL